MNGEIDCWQCGYDAYQEGADMSMDPYEPGTECWELWREGWIAALDDDTF